MRRFIIIISLTVLAFGIQSCKTPNEKAEKLFRNYISKEMKFNKSIDVIAVRVDSLFVVDGSLNLYTNLFDELVNVQELLDIESAINQYEKEVQNENRLHTCIANDYHITEIESVVVNEDKIHIDSQKKYEVMKKKYDNKKKKLELSIRDHLKNRYSEGEDRFMGYLVFIEYHIKGNVWFDSTQVDMFIANPKMNEVVRYYSEVPLECIYKYTDYFRSVCHSYKEFDIDELLSYLDL